MASHGEIVVTLAGEVVTADHPVVRADDPLFGRGDGVFETLLLRNGRGCLIGAHLERLERSASTVGLPPPNVAQWRTAVASAAQAWPGAGEAVMRLVLGRGRGGAPIGFVTVSPLPDRALTARRDGVSAMTLDRGSPWPTTRVIPARLRGRSPESSRCPTPPMPLRCATLSVSEWATWC